MGFAAAALCMCVIFNTKLNVDSVHDRRALCTIHGLALLTLPFVVPVCMKQNGSLMCRFAAPTCWNFYHIIHMTKDLCPAKAKTCKGKCIFAVATANPLQGMQHNAADISYSSPSKRFQPSSKPC